MNTSLKFFDRAKHSVSYKNNSFKCNQTNNDNNLLYECLHKECGANIVLDSKKCKIISSNLEHMNHSPLPPMKLKLRSSKNVLQNMNKNNSVKPQNNVSSSTVHDVKLKSMSNNNSNR
uniref:Uncharacterized protein n=1 Tax=Cacopsylla melanoneura TaxID=428564 RepID=A0A8D8ZF17_9HEMI